MLYHTVEGWSVGLDENRITVVTALSSAEREAALREAMTREEPDLRRGIEALVHRRGLATGRAAVVDVAGDVLQEAFTRALRRASIYDPARSAHAWLYKFALNVVLERLRALRMERKQTLHGVTGGDIPDDDGMTPSEAALGRLHDVESTDPHRVIELLDLVPAPAREVLRLRYVDNLRGPELAAALGVNEGAARVRVSRAKAQLAHAYEEAEGRPTHTGEGE